MRLVSRLPLVLLAALALGLPAAQPVQAVSPSIVISQVYGAGGNTGATLRNDYIELFNRGTTTVSLAGWSVQYTSATGTGLFSSSVTSLSGSLAPGQYYLVQESSGGANGAVLPAADATGTIAMAAGSGKVILANTTTGVACNGSSTPCSAAQLAQIVDLVGYGTANFFEGAGAAPTISATTADFRGMGGCTETDTNSADFAAAAPSPRNTATALAPCAGAMPNLSINDVSLNEGDAGTTSFTFTVSLLAPAGAGGVTFDIATADGTATQPGDYTQKSLTGQTIPAGSSTYSFTVLANGDTTPEANETFAVNIVNVTGATPGSTQGQGTITNDDVASVFIHDVQGNGAATPIPGVTVTVEGVVTANFQGTGKLQGFFLQEEDADADADPATSEGIFIFCGGCSTPVAEGQRVRATGTVSEFNNMTEITTGSVVITSAGNNLAQVTPSPIDLPLAGVVDDFYEAREGMKVTFVDTLTVSEYFELARYGQVILYEGGRPRQFTEANPPSVAGNAAQADNLSRRKVILDDDNNAQEWYLTSSTPPGPPDGSQFVYYPRANGGFSAGTQGTDFFRGGDLVAGLTGVLHWSFPGFGADTWRIRPTAAEPAIFTATNLRPATPPNVGGAIKVVGMNLLNYFTTIDTTSSNSTGPCGPGGTLDCRGADSVAELNRQRERASIVICTLNADVFAFMELENTTASATITDLLGAVNARCGGAHPYDFVNTGGTLGTDAIRVQEIYRTGIVSPVGSPLVDLDPVHNRPPTAQTFDVVDAANPVFGERFTVVANHFKSKGCPGTGADADALDGQGCFNGTRTAQATRLLTWITGTVLPAAGDPDVLLLGDFNSYAKEDPVTTLISGGFSDLETLFHGANAYSYLFDGQLGHLDYGFANAALLPQVTGADAWHINADEVSLFDYNDEIRDSPGESTFEEKPDGSALVPPRVVFQPASPFRASDHDPVLVGLFQIADLSAAKVGTPDPVAAGTNLTYSITVANAGPSDALSVSLSDTLPAGTLFISLSSPGGWSCTTPAVGSGGTVSCTAASLSVGSAAFTLTVVVDAGVTDGTILSNTAAVTSTTPDPEPKNDSATETTTVAAGADLQVSKIDSADPLAAGSTQTYTITILNGGPSDAAPVTLTDTLPAGTTFLSLASPGGWTCTTPAVGSGGTVSCSTGSLVAYTAATFTLQVVFDSGLSNGTVVTNTATASSATPEASPGDESGSASTTIGTPTGADLTVTKTGTPDPVLPGGNLTYTITVINGGPADAATVALDDTLPDGTTFQSLASPGGWSCTTPAAGATGTVSCSAATLSPGNAVFTLVVQVDATATPGTLLANTALVFSPTEDPNPENGSSTAFNRVGSPPLVTATKSVSGQLQPGGSVVYTIVLTNSGDGNQADNPGNELTDVPPAELTLVSASATSGTAVATVATNTVTWNGAIAGGGSVTVIINATVNAAIAAGTTISNQGTVAFDADGNGTNEASAATDNPATAGPDATSFQVAAAAVATEIPTLDEVGLALLSLLLAAGGALRLRRRSA